MIKEFQRGVKCDIVVRDVAQYVRQKIDLSEMRKQKLLQRKLNLLNCD